MAEIESTSTETETVDAQAVAEAEAGVASHIVPADEPHVEPQELFGGGEVAEPADADQDETYEPLGAINAHP
ncbi:hypothetical protein ACWGB8_08150 [Kitasatospora sp. NPDC054939]